MSTSTTGSTPTPSPPTDRDGPRDRRLAARMGRLASRRIWIVGTAAFLVFAGVFFASSAPFSIPTVETACGQEPLDVRFFSTGGDVAEFLTACGPDGREAYRDMQIADLAYPAAFGLFMASSLSLVLARLFPRHPSAVGLAVLPLVASGFDYLENVLAWLALTAYPEPAPTDGLLGMASAAKTAISWVAGLLLLTGLVALVVRAPRRQVQVGGAEPGGLPPLAGDAPS